MNRSTPLSHRRLLLAATCFLIASVAAVLVLIPTPARADSIVEGTILRDTPVYTSSSGSGTPVATLKEGVAAKGLLRDSNENWLEATMSVNGRTTTVFFSKANLEQFTGDGVTREGATILGEMKLYRSPSTTGSVVERIPEGTPISFTIFNGKFSFARLSTGEVVYIPRNQVVWYRGTSKTPVTVYALASGAKAYKAPYVGASSYQTFRSGTKLTLLDFANDWYTAKMNVGGKSVSVYLRKSELSSAQQTTNPAPSPETPAPTEGEVVDGDATITYSDYKLTLTSAAQMQFSQRSPVGYYGGKASFDEVYKYMDPSLAQQGTTWFLQFLRLDKSAGVTASQINARLSGKGVLQGQGASFIEAGRANGINELYLVAHAELETGNGMSRLAKGAWYNENYNHPGDPNRHWVEEKPADTTGWVRVYNMYGIGAYDGNVYNGGFDYAFKSGWNTPESAIIGGARFIGSTYIARGQNTLYKMRWNPDYMSANQTTSWRQYATDVGWAVKQTAFISSMYRNIDVYAMHFDVPRYSGK